MNRQEIDRGIYTVVGAGAYGLDQLRWIYTAGPRSTSHKEGPRIGFIFWDAPDFSESVRLLNELHYKFDGTGLEIAAGLNLTPWGTVSGEDKNFRYDTRGINRFGEACVVTNTKLYYINSGMQWNDVSHPKSPLLEKLESRDENRMKYEDGSPVQRVLQPPSNRLPKRFQGMFGSDKNGVLYLSYHAPEVRDYREQNLHGVAEAIASFAKAHHDLYLGTCLENEVDFPGAWIAGDKTTDWGEFARRERERRGLDLGEFNLATVQEVLETNVRIFAEHGVTKLYTNQSIEDAEHRSSPLSTALVEGANVGVTAWRMGNRELYVGASELAKANGRRWALPIFNPLSLIDVDIITEFQRILSYQPDLIGIYNWWPHFPGYGVRGLPLEGVVKAYTR